MSYLLSASLKLVANIILPLAGISLIALTLGVVARVCLGDECKLCCLSSSFLKEFWKIVLETATPMGWPRVQQEVMTVSPLSTGLQAA